MSTSDRQKVEGYLANQWYCKLSYANPLPSNHPYYTTNPVNTITSISGISVYFSAEYNVTTSNGLVSSWADQSGHGWNATQYSSESLRPTLSNTGLNSLPCIVFNGTTPSMGLSFQGGSSSVSSYTICMVMYFTLNTFTYNVIFRAPNNFNINLYIYKSQITNKIYLTLNTFATSFTCELTQQENVPFILIITANWLSVSVYINGITIAQSSLIQATHVSMDFSYFVLSGDSIDMFKGGISSLIIYDTILSTSNRHIVEGYLAWKWWTYAYYILSFDHPYSYIPPY